MKASELVEKLNEAIKNQGDLEVRYSLCEEPDPEFGDSRNIAGLGTVLCEQDEPHYYLIGDDAVMDNFVI